MMECSNETVAEVQDDYEAAMSSCSNKEGGVVVDDHQGPLPGFRFHPTDEELVSFYLKRIVEKRPPLCLDIIKQIDIYKHDPWDLAKGSSSIGDKEWYFYCKRGRKYRNSIRPNRVTGSGFWKATGIDRPIYSNEHDEQEQQQPQQPHHHHQHHQHHQRCIGLKKSLVYYRGSAGKGTKTDWMMHEFRLPTQHPHLSSHYPNLKDTPLLELEAEIWTLCRIFKRNKRHTPDWREISIGSRKNSSSKASSSIIESNNNQECYISFASHQAAINNGYNNHNHHVGIDDNGLIGNPNITTIDDHQQLTQWNSMAHNPPGPSMLNQYDENNDHQSLAYYWDDLTSVVGFAFKKPFL